MPKVKDCPTCLGSGICPCDACTEDSQWREDKKDIHCQTCGYSFFPCDIVMIGESGINRRHLRYIFAYLEAETVLLAMEEGKTRGTHPSWICDKADRWRIAIMPIVKGEMKPRAEFTL